jgi:putative aminopeptidase FrvX
MEPQSLDFLKRVLETPSPAGYERPVQDIVRQFAGDFADEIRTDLHGNVIAVKNPQAPLRVMLAGHCDQIGLLVQHIDDQGFLWVQPIGGWDPQMLIGQRMTVWTDSGPVPGIISRKAIHLLTDEERKQVVNTRCDTQRRSFALKAGWPFLEKGHHRFAGIGRGDQLTLRPPFKRLLRMPVESVTLVDQQLGHADRERSVRLDRFRQLNCSR